MCLHFDTFDTVPDMKDCVKKPMKVQAKQIWKNFTVDSLEGNYKLGKPGDYLMKCIDGELFICDRAIFERSYDFV